ncbi:MAG TPA: hypothetical protein VFM93_01765 [Candidatus Limnocylindria bacterium]|nr:hypothetical protein [Candidatus Limnocylindria bacterium]
MTVELTEWFRLRRLLREAAEAAEGPTAPAVEPPLAPLEAEGEPAHGALEKAERERVIELGVTGFIVRFPDSNPVLLGAVSRIQGWRPNPSGSHHVPCTLPAITSLLAFAEMYDFELTDGADSMVRQMIRDSYRTREWHRETEAAATRAGELRPAPRHRIVRPRRHAALAWLGRNWRAIALGALVLYLTGPKLEIVREASRSYLEPAPLGAAASLTTVLGALSRCETAKPAPGAPLPPGCDATVGTRPEVLRIALGSQNPRLRVFSWTSLDGARGFAVCDQSAPLEECWDR